MNKKENLKQDINSSEAMLNAAVLFSVAGRLGLRLQVLHSALPHDKIA